MSQKATLDEVGINKGFCVLLIKQHINFAAKSFCVYWGEKNTLNKWENFHRNFDLRPIHFYRTEAVLKKAM